VYDRNIMITSKVIITKSAEKQATRAPQYIRDNLLYWKKEVELFGIQAIRQHKGYHDEPLKGEVVPFSVEICNPSLGADLS
jgi:hypothetical protein